MTENRIVPESERDYWLTWAEQLPAPAGTIFDARSYSAWKLTQKEPLQVIKPNERRLDS